MFFWSILKWYNDTAWDTLYWLIYILCFGLIILRYRYRNNVDNKKHLQEFVFFCLAILIFFVYCCYYKLYMEEEIKNINKINIDSEYDNFSFVNNKAITFDFLETVVKCVENNFNVSSFPVKVFDKLILTWLLYWIYFIIFYLFLWYYDSKLYNIKQHMIILKSINESNMIGYFKKIHNDYHEIHDYY